MEILEEVLLPTIREMAIPHPEPILLVQDNSPVHKSKVVDEWFREHPEFVVCTGLLAHLTLTL